MSKLKYSPIRKLICDELEKGTPLSSTELADRINVARETINTSLRELKADKMVYIKDWSVPGSGGGARSALYALGKGKDKPKPPTKAQLKRDRIDAKRGRRQAVNHVHISADAVPSIWGQLIAMSGS